jgi:hypothetical protein
MGDAKRRKIAGTYHTPIKTEGQTLLDSALQITDEYTLFDRYDEISFEWEGNIFNVSMLITNPGNAFLFTVQTSVELCLSRELYSISEPEFEEVESIVMGLFDGSIRILESKREKACGHYLKRLIEKSENFRESLLEHLLPIGLKNFD